MPISSQQARGGIHHGQVTSSSQGQYLHVKPILSTCANTFFLSKKKYNFIIVVLLLNKKNVKFVHLSLKNVIILLPLFVVLFFVVYARC